MKAITFDRFGDPGVLQLSEVDVPEPGQGQVRVKVHTAGVNPVDGKIRSGAMQAVFPTTLPSTPGLDVAGVVDAVGEGVTGLTVGQEVVGWADSGSYAEYALATVVAAKPAGLGWEDAATLPVAGETARRVLRVLEVGAGDTLLIHGAAGAVGSLAAQLAVALGATVIGTASAANHDYVASLGATPVEYGDGLVDRVRALAPKGIDAVFDAAGRGALPDSITLRGGTDRIVTIADPAAQELGITFSGGGDDRSRGEDLAEVVERAARGELRVRIGAVYPLADAAEAHRVSDGGHAPGKLVLTVA
ncbi:NADP-dependent oxidoreductase [Amycolatopsis sp. NPDC059021]|uniref:NADP-dependent oxidoreductase n=1 Tax=Amycolatopsis sp. NPDC059021 TaxID=3346704 RepID=UPI00366EF9D3